MLKQLTQGGAGTIFKAEALSKRCRAFGREIVVKKLAGKQFQFFYT
jgi:hypothetical protein